MRRIRIQNPLLDKNYRTYINADYSATTTMTVANNVSFQANDILVVGEPREELTESKKINNVSGNTTFNLPSVLNFDHPKGTPIYRTLWDFVSIERATSSGGVFAEITQSSIQWDNKLNETVYIDSAATSSYQYRFRFYNSSTSTYSEYSDTQTGAALDRQSVAYMIDEVRTLTGDIERKIVTDEEIIRSFNRGQDLIYIHNPKYWFLFVDIQQIGSGSIPATASSNVYSLANLTNFGHLASIKYRYNSGGTDITYHLTKKAPIEFDRQDSNANITAQDWTEIYKLLPPDPSSANGYFKIVPKTLNTGIGTFYPNYYKKMPNLDSPADVTLVPLPDILIDYAVGYVERIKGNESKAQTYEQSLEEHTISLRGRAVTIEAKGLKMLDTLNSAQKEAIDQPRSLIRFMGQKGFSRLFGNRTAPLQSPDYYKENYF